MATRKKPTASSGKLVGKTVAFVGKFGQTGYGGRTLDDMKILVGAEGGTVVDGEKTAPDYLVAGAGVGSNPPAAIAKIQKKHPHVRPIDDARFYQLTNPTPDEFLKLILAKSSGHDFWSALQMRMHRAGVVLDIKGVDLRKRTIQGTLYNVRLDGSDLRGARISAYFHQVKDAKFDGAVMNGGSFSDAEGCSLKNVVMKGVRWNPASFVRCDFSGSRLDIQTGSFTTATECSFKKADLSGADLDQSKFADCNFSGAKLTKARLDKCDFTGANLMGADLSGADLRNAILRNVDCRKARFANALLSGADLTGATIDGADFTGAHVTGADFTGLDVKKAKNLRPRAARTAGPKMRELADVAKGVKRLTTEIELELGTDEFVLLQAGQSNYGSQAYFSANYTHKQGNATIGNYVDAPSLEQAMLNLTDRWNQGTPRFETVKADAKKGSLAGKELKVLATMAWHEACGLHAPSVAELQRAAVQVGSDRAKLRKAMIAELTADSAGVARWNARSDKERSTLGKLRNLELTNAELAEARLSGQDLEGTRFDGADLHNANFHDAKLKSASFANANLHGAYLAGSRCADASFVGATATKCNLRAASFLRVNFQNADLTGSDFSFSDLRGADLSTAKLDAVEFFRTKFDGKTVFPKGFVAPEGLEWKGTGPRPSGAASNAN